MTRLTRLKAWAAQAPRAQVVSTGVVTGLLVVALLGSTVVPEDEGSGSVAGGLLAGDAAPIAGDPSSSGATPVDAAPVGGGTVDGGSGAPAHGGAGGAPVGVGGSGPSPAQGGAGPTGGSGGGPAATPAGGAGTAPDTTPRVASDQGVTPEAIKLGFTISRTGGLSATGFALGIRQDQPEAIKALVDHVNKAGGVKGRKLTYVVVEEDPTDQRTWQPACVRLTQDEKVFSVVSSANHLGVGHQCYVERRMPNPNSASSTMSASLFQKGGGYLASTGASGSRGMLNWAAEMLAAGAIGPGKGSLGLLTDECPQDVEIFDRDVKPFLKSQGVKIEEARLSCDVGAAQQQVPSAVLRLRNAGVDRVFLGVIFSTAQTFMQQAEAQTWRPTYFVSDLWGNNLDFLSQNFPPEQFDRTIATTYTHQGEEAAKVPYSEPTKRCSKILSDGGVPPITDQMGADAEIIGICDSFFLWLRVMEKLPTNFTRAQWAAAVPSIGQMAGLYGATANFRSGKYDGGDAYALLEWRKECTCWIQIRPHKPARY